MQRAKRGSVLERAGGGAPGPGLNQLAGYDNKGHPFFLPRGCSLPMPVGFTSDGIAYYDIPSLVHQRGIMVRPSAEKEPQWAPEEYAVAEGIEPGAATDDEGMPIDVEYETLELIKSLLAQEHFEAALGRQKVPLGNKIRRLTFPRGGRGGARSEEVGDEAAEVVLSEPTDIVQFFRESEDVTVWKPAPMKISIEPLMIEFRSVNSKLTRVALLRYRAGRGDHTERDFFVSVSPVGTFEVRSFHLRLQGEGVIEIQVTYHPTGMKTEKAEGSLNLIDDEGEKLGTCTLIAIRQSFVRITPQNIDAGWVLPGRRKEISYKIENISCGLITVDIVQQSEVLAAQVTATNRSTPPRPSPFVVPQKQAKIQASESRTMAVYFEPSMLGHFSDVIEIYTPGGDVLKVTMHGVAGIPIAIFPEDAESSAAGAAALTRERCDFMNRFRRYGNAAEKVHVPLTEKGTAILKHILSATSDTDSRKEIHTLDFGVCASAEPVLRCLTLMNLSDAPITVGLYSHNPAFQCPYMIRVAQRMANAVEMRFVPHESTRGTVTSVIEIVCPEFQNIMLNVKVYVGQPVFFLSWDFAFFRPCRVGQQESLVFALVNDAQCPLSVVMPGPVESGALSNSVTSSLSSVPATPTIMAASSVIPVNFRFFAKQRGPFLQNITLQVVSPFQCEFLAGINGRHFHVAAIVIEPYQRERDTPDKNSIDFMRMWMSHPRRLTDEFPSQEEIARRFDLSPVSAKSALPSLTNVEWKQGTVTFRPTGSKSAGVGAGGSVSMRKSQVVTTTISNKTKEHPLTVFFASTCFSVDPRQKVLQAGEVENVDIMYIPPPDVWDAVTTYGFAVALLDRDHTMTSTQLIGKQRSDFLVFPAASKGQDIVLDFGCVETTANKLETPPMYLTFYNLYPTSYSWTIKFTNSRTKFMPFEAGMVFGELGSFESYSLPIRFHCDSSGTFEATAEIYVRETLERNAQASKVANVILRGMTVFTNIIGYPEFMDFGSTAVFHHKVKQFNLNNVGTTEVLVTLLVRAPFQAVPKSFHLKPTESMPTTVTYSPTESRTTQVKMQIFTNHKLQIVPLSGTGGLAELVCEKYEGKDVDFGIQREGTVAWLDCYLTNKGSLALTLTAVTANIPDLVRIEFVRVTSSVPYESGKRIQAKGLEDMVIRKDYWGVVKRKIRIIVILKLLANRASGKRKRTGLLRKDTSMQQEQGSIIKVQKSNATDAITAELINGSTIPKNVPTLKPFYSYHMRLGFTNKYQAKRATELRFYYLPVTTDEDDSELPSLLKFMRLNLVGAVYRVLEFLPPFHDFGLVPAESFLQQQSKMQDAMQNYGVVRDDNSEASNILSLEVLNMGFDVQNLALRSITPPFSITARTWCLQPGDKVHIPVEFHPPQEQIQYRGEAVFAQKYGVNVISLVGTGASADVTCEPELHFGTLRLQAMATKQLILSNRGLLQCKFSIQLLQKGSEFRFAKSDEPHDYEGTIDSGSTAPIDIHCCCQSVVVAPAQALVRWQRVPRGKWDDISVQLGVMVGQPTFRLAAIELDFATAYIGVPKAKELTISNDGNAVCEWTADAEKERGITVQPSAGTLSIGAAQVLTVKVDPPDFQPISSAIRFLTDAGTKSLMCYGIVGVPFLYISDQDRKVDFGIVEINRSHAREIVLRNTGTRTIDFTVTLDNVEVDGVAIPIEDSDVYFVSPSQGLADPGQEAVVTCTAFPREYNADVRANLVIRTTDGERQISKLSCVGGKAIVKIGRPTPAAPTDAPTAPRAATVVKTANVLDATRLAFQTHIDILQEVLAGLRSAELDAKAEEELEQFGGVSVSPEANLEAKPTTAPRSARPRTSARPPSRSQGFFDGSSARADRGKAAGPLDEQILCLTDDIACMAEALNMRMTGTPHSAEVKAFRTASARRKPSFATVAEAAPFSTVSAESIKTIAEGRPTTPAAEIPRTLSRPPTAAAATRPATAASRGVGPAASRPVSAAVSQVMQDATDEDFVQKVNDTVMSRTNLIIRAVKDRLRNSRSKNREFLTSALRKLQESVGNVEEVVETGGGTRDETVFSLGLIRGGDRVPEMLLFNLPNTGNLSFDYSIVPRADNTIIPPECDRNERDNEMFVIQPSTGTILPKQSVNILTTFQARPSGLYQQPYELRSSGDAVLKFTVTATVGNPLITVSPQVCDFGLLRKNTSSSRIIVVSNVGTYKDVFRIEPVTSGQAISEDEESASPPAFVFGVTKADLEPQQEFPITVVFTPPGEGVFTNKYHVNWSKEPIVFQARGEGGGAKLRIGYKTQEDETFGGLDWGVCVVGATYEKTFELKNTGNCSAECTIGHAESAFRFDVKTRDDGYVVVRPSASVNVRALLTPNAPGKIKEPIQIRLSEGPVVGVPLKAMFGTCSYEIERQLNITNMALNAIQTKHVRFLCTGDLEIPFDARIEPPELREIVNLRISGARPDGLVQPKESVLVDLSISPKQDKHYDGRVVITVNLGRGPVTEDLPISFRAYKDQLALDDTQSASVGRVTVGETAVVERTLTNWGTTPLEYRVVLKGVEKERPTTSQTAEPTGERTSPASRKSTPKSAKSGKKPKTGKRTKTPATPTSAQLAEMAWKLGTPSIGIIQPGESTVIQAVYRALASAGDQWQDAVFTVESLTDSETKQWTTIASVPITGATGMPILSLNTCDIDFGHVSPGKKIEHSLDIVNEGTSLLSYEVMGGYDHEDIFVFSTSPGLSGYVKPAERVTLKLAFCPAEVHDYESVFNLRTNAEHKAISLKGHGAIFKIKEDKLPKILVIGCAYIGEATEKQFAVINDCTCPVPIEITVTATSVEEQESQTPLISDFKIVPSVFELPAVDNRVGVDDIQPSSVDVRIQFTPAVPLMNMASRDAVDLTRLVEMLNTFPRRHFIRVSSPVFQAPLQFPVTHQLAVRPLESFHIRAADPQRRAAAPAEVDRIQTIDFGQAPMHAGSDYHIAIYNPNVYKLPYEIAISDRQFTADVASGTVAGKGFRELAIVLNPHPVPDEEDVPPFINYFGTLSISIGVPDTEVVTLDLKATLVDEAEVDYARALDFADVFLGATKALNYSVRNPFRRTVPFSFAVGESGETAFVRSKLDGNLAPRQSTSIPILFRPTAALKYSSIAVLTLEDTITQVELLGVGVAPTLSVKPDDLDFGIVGIGEPEWRNVELANQCPLPMNMDLLVIGDGFFLSDVPAKFELAPSETRSFKVTFKPISKDAYKSQLDIRRVDQGVEQPKSVATCNLRGVGGTFALSQTKQVVTISKVAVQTSTRQTFTIENSGDTEVEIDLADEFGNLLKDNVEVTPGGPEAHVSYRLSQTRAVIKRKSRQTFTVSIKGLQEGQTEVTLLARTGRLLTPKTVPIVINATVTPGKKVADAVQAFARVDNTVENVLSMDAQEDAIYDSEQGLWKVLLPVVRVSSVLPSKDLAPVAALEPVIDDVDVGPFVIRPPALPSELYEAGQKKWYSNRVFLKLDEKKQDAASSVTSRQQNQADVLSFMKPVEKTIYLEKKRQI